MGNKWGHSTAGTAKFAVGRHSSRALDCCTTPYQPGWALLTYLGGNPERGGASGAWAQVCSLFSTTTCLTNLQMINQLPQAHLAKIPAAFPLLSGSFSAKILGAIQLFYCLMLLLSHSPSIRISITALKYHWIVQAQLSRHDLVLVIKNTSYCVTALQAHSPSS